MKLSHSSAFDFQTCYKRYFHKHIARDVPYEKTAATERGTAVHKAFEDRLTIGKPFPEDMPYEQFAKGLNGHKVQAELRLGIRADGHTCGFYDDDCFWNGKLDCVVIEGPAALLLDWKTGAEYEDPTELRRHAVLLVARFPTLEKITGRYVWLKPGRLGVAHDLSDVKRTWAEMRSLGETVEASTRLNHFPEREGPLCKWCPVHQCRFNRNGAITAGN